MKELSLFEEPIQGKPFLKWAGGKGQLIDAISAHLPNMDNIDTYVEPFIGSGAVMFWLVSNYPNIKQVVINDLNTELVNLYQIIKYDVEGLITELKALDSEYKARPTQEERSEYYYQIRVEYNARDLASRERNVRLAALFIFLNRTCFNGLYRVNGKNLFNVPFGKYANPKICDEDNLRNDSALLQKVEILNGDYAETLQYLSERTFYYLDPPYKPISETSSFNSYSSMSFDDEQQIRLKGFCDAINAHNGKFMLSNSDPKSVDDTNTFFDDLYRDYNINRVLAKRNINAKGNKRGEINELLITNF
ncbi:DNA adenine methylase [Xylanibacter ruminicola]|uniref:DNA adenine methylase n=1 Tax=Xylanibacter ruminicola TaxID=839 RepID=UPI00068DE080|nr:DNA adenine methylase [Xylanibacter ruminicola]